MDCLMSRTGLVLLPHESAQSFETLQAPGVIGDTQTIDRDALVEAEYAAQRGYFATIDKIMIAGVPVTVFANSGPVDLEEKVSAQVRSVIK
ncbi:hypothetical protein Ac2012v2_007542 [Leucoagaricus gongylophorus]